MRLKGTILVQELSRGGSGQRSRSDIEIFKQPSNPADFTAVAGSHLQSPLTDATTIKLPNQNAAN